MNWDDLRLFLAVARSGSISSGARQLDLQHSTVSRRMRKLEKELRVRLFDKVPSGYTLTSEGKALKARAADIERAFLAVDDTLAGKDQHPSGPLRVTAIDNMASTILMPMFARFSQSYPDICLHLMVSNTDVSLSQREADIAIRLTNTPPDTLIGKRVATVSSAIYGSRNYLRRLHEKGNEAEWIGVDCCQFHRSWTRQECNKATHRFSVDDTLLTQAALREGLGIAILPCFMGDTDPALARYSEPRPEWDLGLWVLNHPDLKRTARVLAFRDFISTEIKQQEHVFLGQEHPG